MHDDSVLPGLRPIAAAVHAHGALLGVELNHAGQGRPLRRLAAGARSGPSPVACAEIGGEVPHELTPTEIDEVVAGFAAAAHRAVRGGADVVSVHGAHGYLIGQFVSPRSNRRTDRYAAAHGLPRRRAGRPSATPVGEQVPLFLRWSAFEGLPGGLDEDGAAARAARCSARPRRRGRPLRGNLRRRPLDHAQRRGRGGLPRRGWLGATATRPGFRLGGRPDQLARRSPRALSRTGDTDLVSVARALHADPAWARHAIDGHRRRGRASRATRAAPTSSSPGSPLWCTANPATGHEGGSFSAPGASRRTSRRAPESDRRRRLRARGTAGRAHARRGRAGPSPCTRGPAPSVDSSPWRLGSRAKPQFGRLLDWYLDQLRRLEVELHSGSEVGAASRSAERRRRCGRRDRRPDYLPACRVTGLHRVVGLRDAGWPGRPDRPGAVTVWGADRCGVYVADQLWHGLGWTSPSSVRRRSSRRTRVLVSGCPPWSGSRTERPSCTSARSSKRWRADELVLVGRRTTRRRPGAGPVLVSLGAVPVGLSLSGPPGCRSCGAGRGGG